MNIDNYTDDELVGVETNVSENVVEAVGCENCVSGSSCEPMRTSSVVNTSY